MKVTRIYTGDDGQSHFEDLEMPMTETAIGGVSEHIPTVRTMFRDTAMNGPAVYDWHVAPARQFVLHLKGVVEIEIGGGEKRNFGPGDLLLADDTTGQGHISREVEGPRVQVFAVLADDADIDAWRT